MRRLRLVEEYRGRRIVTDGQMYGIRAELITDCRYLDVAGARAAIDSELGIARRQKDYERQREDAAQYMAREGQEWAYACDCGWRGRYNELKQTGKPLFFSCPACSSGGIMFSMGADPADELPAHARRRRTAKEKKNKP